MILGRRIHGRIVHVKVTRANVAVSAHVETLHALHRGFVQHAVGGAVAAANAFVGTLPYIIIAVIMIAWLKAAGAEAYVARAFEGRETRMIVFASLLGGLAPFCSCEVIPFIAGLLTMGAPLSAVMAFWLSSPLVDPPTLIITASALGWPFAVGKALAAVALGLFGGFAIKAMMAGGLFANPLRIRSGSGCGCGPDPFNGKPAWAFWREQDRRPRSNRHVGQSHSCRSR